MNSLLLYGAESERLVFRAVSTSDFESWLPFYDDPESTRYWNGIPNDPVIAGREQFAIIFQRIKKGLGGMNALVEKNSGAFIGICGLLVQVVDNRKELEIGYSLLPDSRNKGLATEAALHCKKYAFANQLAPSLISIIQVDNTPSQKVALKLGMKIDTTTSYKNNPVHIYRVYPDKIRV
jgi:[ribosomal protein S5]-alanine N-acetyltransferase